MTSDEHRRLAERPIADARAFELFLQARQELRRYAVNRAVALIREAIRIEGETPPLMSQLTWAKVMQVRAGLARDRGLLEDAEREARELLVRVPDAPYGHSLLGHIAYERGQLPGAVHHCKLALAREPNDSDTLLIMCVSYAGAGRNSDARATAARMVACDPLAPHSWMASGFPHWFVGQPEQAIPDLRHALDIDPGNFITHWCLGYSYALVGRPADALRHAMTLDGIGTDVPYTRQLLALIDGLERRPQAALDRIASIDVASLDAHHRFHLAESFIVAGDHDRGLDLLEQSVEGFHPYPYMAEYCRFLDPVRESPRFAAVLATARARSETFARREAALGTSA